ncbi:MAG: Fpg/Nei family DNA glycosylase [Candidatus Eisenbacteria bacterium]|jgi:formamidopyrimidine-DNA glycosylase|nr:Fpg/Nei family DNA glycosylase [Candidatus Eisenbacteria bacterium]
MPEMPELEILREGLSLRVLDRPIARVVVHQAASIKTFYPPIESLLGQRFTEVSRRGKFVILTMESGDNLVIHLMRSGWLTVRIPGQEPNRCDALNILFRDGSALVVLERGSKRKACVYLVRELAAVPFLNGVGVEPFDDGFTAERLFEYLQTERMQLKSFLIDQRFVAGLGNAYADEILFDCGLSPFKITTTLTFEETQRLQVSVRRILDRGIARLRSVVGEGILECEDHGFMTLHGRPGEACPRCGAPIAEIRYSDRSTHYCPECQSGGKVYADRRAGTCR